MPTSDPIKPLWFSGRSRLILAGLVPALLSACATMKVPETKVQSPAAYPLNAQQKDLTVAVYPMLQKEEIKKTFGTDLRSKGLMPILVVAENHNASTSYIVAKENVFVRDARSEANESTARGGVTSTTAGTAVTAVGLAAISLPLVVAGLKLASDAQVIEHGLSDKEFYSRTLGPGQSGHGFIYFQTPKDQPLNGQHEVIIQAVDANTREPLTFRFPLQ